MTLDDVREWLEADGRGGFASGTASGVRTRRYHALLLTTVTPPTGRFVLVNGVDAWVDAGTGREALTTQRYAPDVLHPDGAAHLVRFTHTPWPTWDTRTTSGCRVVHELRVEPSSGVVALSWRVAEAAGPVTLAVRPFLSGRDYHALHQMNPAFRFEPVMSGARVLFTPYEGVPQIACDATGSYTHQPFWYRNAYYRVERQRGLDSLEDLASPGEFVWQLRVGEQALLLLSANPQTGAPSSFEEVASRFDRLVKDERERRDSSGSRLVRAADAYMTARGTGRTIVAGYPWFTDWGRDTFIALRGLCLATGRLAEARTILLQWSDWISEGMLPNRFPDAGEQPEFNSVDASLWFVIAVHELLERSTTDAPALLSPDDRAHLQESIERVVSAYASGTRFGIHADEDGLLACGVVGSQITWMDARIGDRAVTPRVGKPVEVQALWLNALRCAAVGNARWRDVLDTGSRSFLERFWNEDTGTLSDVVDVNHVRGTRDTRCRPNQILAVGGLPLRLVDDARAARIVAGVEQHLVTPLGLRTLAPFDPSYIGRYEGGVSERDTAYHQGTAWPWLLGPFVDAWVHVHGNTSEVRQAARERFLTPLFAHLDEAGLDHVSEIVDGDAPHTPRGCPFQAWSLGEMIRLDREILRVDRPTPDPQVVP